MKKYSALSIVILLVFAMSCKKSSDDSRMRIATAMESTLKQSILDSWYPKAVDTLYGGFLSSFTYDFKPTDDQEKMIVTQARHTWTNSKASRFFSSEPQYARNAKHGFEFLRDVMWDKQKGGFYQLVERDGKVKGDSSKTAYGNSFGIYALAAYYEASGDTAGLNLAKKAFMWLETKGSHDPKLKGYFQHLHRDGSPIVRPANTPNTSDLGYKDQNSSIHLLEALTELYHVWPDPLLRERLQEMLLLIRDTIVTPRGNLTLFLLPDWTPVSFADSSEASVLKHHNLDHVSFGHDVETAYLLLEASEALQLENDSVTKKISKKMVDHALENGWDANAGGFYDEGYYFKGKSGITTIRDTKNWWAQAEGLNTLSMMSQMYPDDAHRYYEKFEELWKYCDTYLIDHENGDFYSGGLDKQPEMKTALKGNIWKAAYHQYRSLENCVKRLNPGRKTK